MKTEYRLANALKSLMSERKSLDEISVTQLTKKCKVGRQTFYYHFHDMYDLLTMVFLNEEIKKGKDDKTLNGLLESVFEYYEKNANFINGVLASGGRDLFVSFLNNHCYTNLLKMVALADKEKDTTLNERKIIARFYASAIANNLTFYFDNAKKKTLPGLKKSFSLLGKDFLERAVKNTVRNRTN